MIALSGVRSSWDMLARKVLLCRLVSSAWSRSSRALRWAACSAATAVRTRLIVHMTISALNTSIASIATQRSKPIGVSSRASSNA
jgi:hypothetical protein